MDIAAVALGAGIGGGLRYALGSWLLGRWGDAFPWHTFAINIGGAFLVGILGALAFERELLTPQTTRFLAAGVLGGFTTFSAMSYEGLALLEAGRRLHALAYMFGSPAAGLLAAWLGLLVGRMISVRG